MSARKVVVEFLGEDKSLGKTMGDIDGKSGRLMGALGKVGKVAGAALVGGAVAGGAALFNMGQKAGDLNETISKSEQIFGKSAGGLQKWAKTGADSFGMSQQTALDAAATFGVFGKAAGKTGGDLAKFATQNTELAADLASFHNSTPEEAIEALGAAFRGEAEPLRRFGVLLDDASMREQALKMGLIATTKEALTPQQKTLAAQALIMQQTSDAQGDFERTSGGLANQQRILKAEFENMQTTIGQRVLPILLSLATFANNTLVPALGRAGAWIEANVLPALGRMGDWIQARVVPALQKMGDWISAHVLPIFQRLGSEGPSIFAKVRGAIEPVIRTVISIAQNVAGKLAPVFEQLVATFRSKVIPTAALVIDRFQEWWPTISRVVSKLADLGATIVAKVLPYVIRFAGFLISNVVPAVLDTIEILAKIIGKVIAVGGAFIDGVRDVAKWVGGVKEKIANALELVGDIPGKARDALAGLGSTLLNAGRELIQGLIDGISEKVSALRDKLGSITKMIPDWKGPLDKDKILLTPAGVALMEGLIRGIDKGKKKLQTVLEKITDYIKGKQDELADLLSKRQSIIDSFKGFGASVFGADTGTEDSPASVQKLVDFSADQRARADQLNASVGTLIAKGLSRELIQQMIDQGQSGVDQINLLATATDEQIRQLNANNAATTAALAAAGLKAADAMLKDQIDGAQRDLALADSIRDKLAELLKQQDKNTIVQLNIDGKVLHVSLLRLKRESGKKLNLD